MNKQEIADYIRNSFTYDDGGISGEVNYLELADWHINKQIELLEKLFNSADDGNWRFVIRDMEAELKA